jgi:hypothetical protein
MCQESSWVTPNTPYDAQALSVANQLLDEGRDVEVTDRRTLVPLDINSNR